MKLIINIEKYLFTLFTSLAISAFFPVLAQTVMFKTTPIGIRLVENGQKVEKPDTIDQGKSFILGSAPMTIAFKAQVEATGISFWTCQWKISKSEDFETNYIMPRSDDDTEYDLNESGTYYVKLLASYINEEGETVEYPDSEPFIIPISESDLKVPNAFSPNGDGMNDIFKVTYKSLVRFNAYVFNRWGQEIYRWGLSNIDEGWDGTFKGKPVKDGVYFIVIEAEGSDGRKYKHKGDINILRGFSGTGSMPTPEN